MNYGVPYKGSKSRIVANLADAIPHVGIGNFYDLFAGGCAVTHKMMLDKRYRHYYANDLDGKALRLFQAAIRGEFHDEKRWISRQDFFRLKDTDPYVACCWSFGNNQRDYIYSQKIEPYKKACHYAIVQDDFSLLDELCPEVAAACEEVLEGVTDTHERRIKFGPTIVNWLKAHGTAEMLANNPLYASCHTKKDTKTRPKGTIRDLQRLQSLERLQRLQSLQSLERLQRLQSLERLQRLQSLERLESLERLQSLQSLQSLQRLESLQRLQTSCVDYREVEIRPRSIIYCDPPYKGTNRYNTGDFDHEAFYDWCCNQSELVLISEYAMPEDRFTEVWRTKHVSSLAATATNAVTERLFVPTRQLAMYKEMMKQSCASLFPTL